MKPIICKPSTVPDQLNKGDMSVVTFRSYAPLLLALTLYTGNASARFVQPDPIGLEGGVNSYAYVNGNPLTYADPTGEIPIIPIVIGLALLGGSQSTSFQNSAANAAQYWANLQVQTGNPLYGLPGALATLADPCNAGTTATVLGAGSGFGAWAGRPYWQYYPAGNPGYSSRWLARGWGWKPPYQPGPQAAQNLSLPPWNPGTAVRPVNPSGFVGGPGPVGPAYGQSGGGTQYFMNGWPRYAP